MRKYVAILIVLQILLCGVEQSYSDSNNNNNFFLKPGQHQDVNVIFKKLSPVELDENVPVGYLIVDLKANLPDLHGAPSQYRFEFVNEDKFLMGSFANASVASPSNSILNSYFKSYFYLDGSSGTVHTSKVLDMENFCDLNLCSAKQQHTRSVKCVIEFRIKASKVVNKTQLVPIGGNKKPNNNPMYFISFDVILRDVNEFKPEFYKKDRFVFNISEEFAPIKLALGSVAYDNDCSDRNGLFYSIEIDKVNGRPYGEFLNELNSTIVDRRQYADVLWAFRRLNDASKFDLFNFELTRDHDETLLFLTTNKSIDRELIQSIELSIIANDRPPADKQHLNSASIRVFLNIADINDNAPRFGSNIYNLEFDEGLEAGTELMKINAYDVDAGLNADLRYEFAIDGEEIRQTFAIDSLSGQLKLRKKLDFAKKNTWQLSIKASDRSLNPKSSIAIVNIRVKDVNNHKPEINVNFFIIPQYIESRLLTVKSIPNDATTKREIIYLNEHVPVNTTIGLLTITDQDSEWNGFIDECRLSLAESADRTDVPLFLDELDHQQSTLYHFSQNSFLNKEIQFIFDKYKLGLKANGNKKYPINQRKYLIRTRVNFSQLSKDSKNYNVEITASDKGPVNKQTAHKRFKLCVKDFDADYGEESDMSEEESLNDYPLRAYEFDYDESMSVDDNSQYESDELVNQYYYARTIYKVYVNENNPIRPIELIRINITDFDLPFSAVKYELLAPSMPMSKPDIANTTKMVRKANRYNCSAYLYNYLSIDAYNGVVTLNKTLNDEPCVQYFYSIRATDVIDPRLSSILTFMLKINTSRDDALRFEQRKYVFKIIENAILNMSVQLKIVNPQSDGHLVYKLEPLSEADDSDLRNYFTLTGDKSNNRSVLLLVKKPLDYEVKKKHTFKISAYENDGAKAIDSAVIEINVLDLNEHAPQVKRLESTNNKSVNVTQLYRNEYLIQVNLDRVRVNQRRMSLLKMDVFDPDSFGEIKSQIVQVLVYEFSKQTPADISGEHLFQLNSNLSLYVDLDALDLLMKKFRFPLASSLTVELTDRDEQSPLSTHINLTLVLVNNHTKYSDMLSLENFLNQKFPRLSRRLTLIHGDGSSSNDFRVNSLRLKDNIREILLNNQISFIIISTLILFLLITLITLVIISIIYSISICRIFKCKLLRGRDFFNDKAASAAGNDVNSNAIEVVTSKYEKSADASQLKRLLNDEKQATTSSSSSSSGSSTTSTTTNLSESKRSGRMKKFLCIKSSSSYTSIKNGASPNEKTNASGNEKFLNDKSKIDYLLDSPIVIRKLYENNDVETQKKYIKKYHLEYLFDDDNNESKLSEFDAIMDANSFSVTSRNEPKHNQARKIKFDCRTSTRSVDNCTDQSMLENNLTVSDVNCNHQHQNLNQNHHTLMANSNGIIRKNAKQPSVYDQNCESIYQTNRKAMTYRKCPIQPDENVWIKNSTSTGKSNYLGFNTNEKEFVL